MIENQKYTYDKLFFNEHILSSLTDAQINNDLLYQSKVINKKQYEVMSNCASHFLIDENTYTFESFKEDDQYRELTLHSIKTMNSCNKSLCKKCMRRVMAQRSKALKFIINAYRPQYKFFFITLTIPNVSKKNMKSAYINLQKTWNKFNNHFKFKNYVKKFETTFNSELENWNHHYHLLLAIDKKTKISYQEIQKVWTQKSKYWFKSEHKNYQVNIQKVKSKINTLELTKYVNKEIFQFNFDSTFNENLENKTFVLDFWKNFQGKSFLLRKGIFQLGSTSNGRFDFSKFEWTKNEKIRNLMLKHKFHSHLFEDENGNLYLRKVDMETGEILNTRVKNVKFNKILEVIVSFVQTHYEKMEELEMKENFVSLETKTEVIKPQKSNLWDMSSSMDQGFTEQYIDDVSLKWMRKLSHMMFPYKNDFWMYNSLDKKIENFND